MKYKTQTKVVDPCKLGSHEYTHEKTLCTQLKNITRKIRIPDAGSNNEFCIFINRYYFETKSTNGELDIEKMIREKLEIEPVYEYLILNT